MILEQSLLQELLGCAMSSGADFAEVFAEHTRQGTITMLGRDVDEIVNEQLSGVGIRLLLGTQSVYASTSDISREGLFRCALQAAVTIKIIRQE